MCGAPYSKFLLHLIILLTPQTHSTNLNFQKRSQMPWLSAVTLIVNTYGSIASVLSKVLKRQNNAKSMQWQISTVNHILRLLRQGGMTRMRVWRLTEAQGVGFPSLVSLDT